MMKINELLDPKISQHQLKNVSDVRNNISNTKNKSVDYLGAGAYASVVYNKNHPGEVIRFNRPVHGDIESDGYFKYIKTLIDTKVMDSNPYFPKIYKIKIYKNSENTVSSYMVEIEKLNRLDKLERESILAIADKMFVNFDEILSKYAKHYSTKQKITEDEYLNDVDNILNIFITVTMTAHKNAHVKIKDKQFIEALKLVVSITKHSGYHFDISESNLMFRYTPVGPQLVITDPIAS